MSRVDRILAEHSLDAWVRTDVSVIKARMRDGYKVSAPWRSDRTPSVGVWAKKGQFYDFGMRDKRGNVINWIEYTRNMSPREAMEFLENGKYTPAPKAKVAVTSEGKSHQPPTMELVQKYQAQVAFAMPYYTKRGIIPEIAKMAKLGYDADHPIYQKITWENGESEWLGRPLLTVPIFTIPNFIGYDGHHQEVRAIHYRYDTDTARQKIRDMFRLGSTHIDKLARWLGADDKENAVFEWLFGDRYANVKGSQSRLFNGNRLLTLDVDQWQPAPLAYIIVAEGPLPAFVAESAGFCCVGLPHSEQHIVPAVAFKNVMRIFIATDEDGAGEKRYEWIKKACPDKQVIRVPMNGKQVDDMVLDGSLEKYMASWNISPDVLLTTATPWL